MIRKVLFQNIPAGYIVGALLGAFAGFLMMMLTLNALELYNSLMDEHGSEGKQYVIINKRLNLLNTFSKNLSNFSREEINELNSANFINDLAPFTRSVFRVEASRGASSQMPYMRTEMFFEAVPDRFLDVHPEGWEWEKGQKRLPIIIPKEYLNLYNFGFAKAQGLPNVSEAIVSQFDFDIVLYQGGYFEKYTGYIAGFTNRIETLLVPLKFLSEANKRFGERPQQQPERIVLELAPNKEKELYAFLNKKGYETTHDAFQGGKVSLLVHMSGFVLITIAVVILMLSLFVFALAMQLTVQRNKEEIYQLILLGYRVRYLWTKYSLFQFLSSLLIFIASSLLVIYLTSVAMGILEGFQVTIEKSPFHSTYLVSILVAVVFSAVISYNTYRMINRLAAKGTE